MEDYIAYEEKLRNDLMKSFGVKPELHQVVFCKTDEEYEKMTGEKDSYGCYLVKDGKGIIYYRPFVSDFLKEGDVIHGVQVTTHENIHAILGKRKLDNNDRKDNFLNEAITSFSAKKKLVDWNLYGYEDCLNDDYNISYCSDLVLQLMSEYNFDREKMFIEIESVLQGNSSEEVSSKITFFTTEVKQGYYDEYYIEPLKEYFSQKKKLTIVEQNLLDAVKKYQYNIDVEINEALEQVRIRQGLSDEEFSNFTNILKNDIILPDIKDKFVYRDFNFEKAVITWGLGLKKK